MSATSSTVQIYIADTFWREPLDYHRAAYLDFKKIPHKESQKELQMYYVDKGLFTSKIIMDKIHPGIKKIEKKNASDAKSNGNVIFTMKRERVTDGSTLYYMYYIITEDDKHVPISDDPKLKKLHAAEEIRKTNLDNQIYDIRMKMMKWITDRTQNLTSDDSTTDVDEVGDNGSNGGKRKTKQKRTNKNKRRVRQTRRYFKR